MWVLEGLQALRLSKRVVDAAVLLQRAKMTRPARRARTPVVFAFMLSMSANVGHILTGDTHVSSKPHHPAVHIQSATHQHLLPTGFASPRLWTCVGISGIISIWLNEEWTELDIHKDVGSAAGRAYVDARNKGTEDMGDLVLELSSQLTSFDFDETFVGAGNCTAGDAYEVQHIRPSMHCRTGAF